MREQKSYYLNPLEKTQKWITLDAEGQVLGRLATKVADILRGKHKPEYTPSVDGGDFVIVINAEKIRVTGKKLDDKVYHWYTGYPGGIRSISLRDKMKKDPAKVLYDTVKGMLPKNNLNRKGIRKLKIYSGATHPHEAQLAGKSAAKKKVSEDNN